MRVSKTTAVAGAAIGLVVGISTAASATTSTSGLVTVTHNDDGTQVSTGVPGQPLFSVSSDNRGVCVGFSYEEGTCIPVTTG